MTWSLRRAHIGSNKSRRAHVCSKEKGRNGPDVPNGTFGDTLNSRSFPLPAWYVHFSESSKGDILSLFIFCSCFHGGRQGGMCSLPLYPELEPQQGVLRSIRLDAML